MTWPILSLVFAQVQFHLWPRQQLLLLASDPLDWLPRCHVTDVHHNKLRQQWSMDNMGTPHTTYPFLPFLPRTIGFLMTPLNFTWVLRISLGISCPDAFWNWQSAHLFSSMTRSSQSLQFEKISCSFLFHVVAPNIPNKHVSTEPFSPRKNPMEMTSHNHLVYVFFEAKYNVAWDCIHM